MLAQSSAIMGKLIELLGFFKHLLVGFVKKRCRIAHFHSLPKVSYDRRGNGIDLNPGNFNSVLQFFSPRVVKYWQRLPRGHGVSTCGAAHILTEHSAGQPALADPV